MSKESRAFPAHIKSARIMVFVDGENLTARYQEERGEAQDLPHVSSRKDTWVWSEFLNNRAHVSCDVVRIHYYASVRGDEKLLGQVEDELKNVGVDAPRVFKRTKTRGSKRVDVSLAVDMLSHAQSRNMDAAVLVAGDEDFLPLVEAVQRTGCRVFLWFVKSGLSPRLQRQADLYFNIGLVLLRENASLHFSAT